MRAPSALTVIAAFTASMACAASARAAQAPTGVWIDHTGRGGVEIKDCGNGNLCGHVVWLKDAGKDSKGCGLQILGDVKPVASGQWDNGWIYSPEKKQKFDVELTPLDGNRLRVKGYKGIKFLSQTMIWNRAPETIERCGGAGTTAATAAPAKEKSEDRAAAPAAPVAPSAAGDKSQVENRDIARRGSGDAARSADTVPDDTPPVDQGTAGAVGDEPGPPTENDAASVEEPEKKGLGALLDGIDLDKGIEVGEGYGLKVDKRADGSKDCRLIVPYVTVNFPCDGDESENGTAEGDQVKE